MRGRFLVLSCLLFASMPVHAFTPPSLWLEELTWPEVKQAVDAGYRRIIIPTGGVEQNGNHVILGKHNKVVRYTAEQIAKQLGHTLIAPVIDHVPEQPHEPFPGTISLSEDTFAALLTETAESMKRSGFRRIYFLGDSYGNQPAQGRVAQDLAEDGAVIASLNEYYDYHFNGQMDWLKARGYSEDAIGGHVGIRDTSEMLVVYPEGVRKEAMKDSPVNDPSGGYGAATQASVAYGKKMLQMKIAAALRQIARIERAEAK